ncbi:LCP family protein [Paenibacillus psychroresistens]|uniref:LCP family protein n=1 Tax=Paenibacillus psychroresistens TaxID=1778678 RepID=UPI001D051EB2|nr:LCP family protein [Paenibacillus psychroresistens]
MRKKIKWSLISIGSIAILLIGYYIIHLYSAVNHIGAAKPNSPIQQLDNISKNDPELAAPKWEGTQRVNILVLGADARGLEKSGNEVPRSDSMMVVSIEPNTKKALLISILRDTYVKIPGHGSDRINAAMALGGPTLAMKTVSNLLDIPIQYYVYMDFKGFIGVVDALGGVSIDVEKDMDYEDAEDDHVYDIHLKQGYQELDGKTALQYVRFRHDAMSDFTRSERQRKFLTAISEKMQSTAGIIKLPSILAAIDPYIETNIDTFSEKMKLGALGFDAKSSGFVGIQVPPAHLLDDTRINGASVLSTDPELLKAYIQDKFVESLTGVEQPLAHMQPTATRRPTSRPSTPKPTPTATPLASVKPTPTPTPTPTSSGEPIIPSESIQPSPSGDPVESISPTEVPVTNVDPTPTPIPSATPIPTTTPVPTVAPNVTPSPKPVIQSGG